MQRAMTVTALAVASLALGIAAADATTIRVAGPGDPYLYAATYGYSNAVRGTTDEYYFTDILQGDSKHAPVSGSETGTRNVLFGGSTTTLTSYASAESSNDHLGTVKASVRTTNDGAQAISDLMFAFTLIGPDAAFVPVTISAYGSASLTGYGIGADAQMIVNNTNPVTNTKDGGIYDVSSYEHHPFETTIAVKPNAGSNNGAPSIYMRATAGAGVSIGLVTGCGTDISCYSGSADAFVDPMITIADPKPASLYTIVVSLTSVPSGIGGGTVSPVPLPAAAPLFGASLLVLGGFARMSRRRTRRTL